jgi:hypothetical protein
MTRPPTGVALAVGDSNVVGFGASVAGVSCVPWVKLVARASGMHCLNTARGGSSLAEIMSEQVPVLPSHSPLAMTMLGTNDLAHSGLDETLLKRILQELVDRSDTVLAATLPANLRQLHHWPDRRMRDAISRVNESITTSADAVGARVIPVDDLFIHEPDRLGPDATHLDAVAHLRIARRALEILDPVLVKKLPAEPAPSIADHRRVLVKRSSLAVRRMVKAAVNR